MAKTRKPRVSKKTSTEVTETVDFGDNDIQDEIIVEEELVEEIEEIELPEEVHEEVTVENVAVEPVVEEVKLPKQNTMGIKEKEAILARIKENAAKFDKDYFDNRKKNGCDYQAFGSWQTRYAEMLNAHFALRGKNIIDIGGAYGSISFAMSQLFPTRVICTDISRHVTDTAKFKGVEYACVPMQLMKGIEDDTFDFAHVSMVFECVDELDHERCVKEILRVLKRGGQCLLLGKGTSALKKHFKKQGECTFAELDKRKDKYGFLTQYQWEHVIVTKL